MPPKAAVEDFDDDFEFDLPTISSSAVAQANANAGTGAGVPQGDQMAAFQKMMEQMGHGPGTGDFGSTLPPSSLASTSGAKSASDGEHKSWVSIYPIYFDAKRHYRKGCRRVSYEKSSPFPTQLWIAKAVGRLQLKCVQEPYKTHPQDWENPGRVKVQLFNQNGSAVDKRFRSKKELFDAIAEMIQPNCGGRPPAMEARKKRVKPATMKKQALAENAKGVAAGSSVTTNVGLSSKKSKKKAAAAASSSSATTGGPTKPTLTKVQRKAVLAAKRDPNPNPIRSRLAHINFPPTLEARLPAHSPALEGGLLNMNLAEAMGGMPPGMPGADALGGLGGMLGGMGLGGNDDDEDEEEDQEEERGKKKDPMNPLNLGRRQRKKVVRIGR
ncbi:related to SEC65 - signal recognition particle subunit [Melanopsichium pennsylvanicum]|uniref:Related to SEC65 - signal recognition particle subunit n=2 Tax=Melanopsichium pennsylvanicum TaxID=63383 RepID=A0AAJ4XMT1_9BASI|nr:related to SEC65-signal recognition particle subunit [Melanopsichium pennsylvanicum 4]SNX85749.1 related to SEC65 - signal recognition particle subunit [Melanopsichium pennsylvanicum]